MEIFKKISSLILYMLILSLLLQHSSLAARKAYVVYLGKHSHDAKIAPLDTFESVTNSHYKLLGSLLGNHQKAKDAIFYSYTKYINGFAAYLEDDEATAIAKYPGVVSVFPNKGHKLHTTRSWQFLGLERDGIIAKESLWTHARFGEDTIIANLDTGVWPEAQSFRDDGLGSIPSKWKGICQKGSDKSFSCNRKLIGARSFNKAFEAAIGPLNSTFSSPRDTEGHGTHTLSTAAGGFVPDANVYGYGNGTAKGGSPNARVATYKVCWPPVNGSECYDADILAAFDAAIHDGVDVLSVSVGGDPGDYFQDGIAIGSFHAVQNGITVVCSAGNSGPKPGSVSNLAPWIITVGASTMDREFPAFVKFGNTSIKGQSLSTTRLPGNKLYPMISSLAAKASNASSNQSQLCMLGSLDPEKVKGKIVVCLRGINARVEKGLTVYKAGGVGMILANDPASGNEIIADAHILPASHISYSEGLIVYAYLNSTKSPLGYISKPKTQLGTKPAPFMAAFSSQGPNTITPQILKPDITAPGVSVIAAYTGAAGPTGLTFDTRRVTFNSISGTSMSCPHISGVVGLLKTLHPDWSPSAIKSAIMTSAITLDNVEETILNASFIKASPFYYGSGHVRPNRAMDPGLVYDLSTRDYYNFLCALGYNSTKLAKFTNGSYSCSSPRSKLENLNYPSVTIPNLQSSMTITRTVKNVGPPGTYIVNVQEPIGVSVTVKPTILKFKRKGEEKTFKVKFELKDRIAAKNYVFGRLIWSDKKHYVSSPLVVKSSS